MAAKFVTVTDIYNNLVNINVERVDYVLAYSKDQTNIMFGPEHKVMVAAPIAQVMKLLSQ
jgi:hypothetical protein